MSIATTDETKSSTVAAAIANETGVDKVIEPTISQVFTEKLDNSDTWQLYFTACQLGGSRYLSHPSWKILSNMDNKRISVMQKQELVNMS